MKNGELLFVETTANTEQIFMRERIKDVEHSIIPIEMLTSAVMNQRMLLRKKLLDVERVEERERVIADFNEMLCDFEKAYLRGLMAMPRFEKYSDIKAVSFLSWYTRYSKFLDMLESSFTECMSNNFIFRFGRSNSIFDVQSFLLANWEVLIYQLPNKPDSSWDMVEITDDTEIEENDWDGVKIKKGKEIIRRNGECGGKVFVFIYMENVDNEGREAREKLFHFYSVSIDGKEMRHYQTKQSF